MLSKLQSFIKYVLDKVNLVSYDQKLSITNLIVYLFTLVTLFRLGLAGFTFTFKEVNWTIPDLNVSVVLPMLFSLLNYSHRRVLNTAAQNKEGNDDQNNAKGV